MTQSVIFDVDGTLLDGTEGIINSVKRINSPLMLLPHQTI